MLILCFLPVPARMGIVKILNVVGARPNFMKIAPIVEAMGDRIEHLLVHTGQHYDSKMSDAFFGDLGIPRPDVDLGVGSGSHAEQTGRVMIEFENLVKEEKPDLVVVVGDVNSTMACTLVAVKLGVPVAHVEAGLRSYDRAMPEEINRMVTDILSHLLQTHSPEAEQNLKNEGVDPSRIHFVGNTMIDVGDKGISLSGGHAFIWDNVFADAGIGAAFKDGTVVHFARNTVVGADVGLDLYEDLTARGGADVLPLEGGAVGQDEGRGRGPGGAHRLAFPSTTTGSPSRIVWRTRPRTSRPWNGVLALRRACSSRSMVQVWSGSTTARLAGWPTSTGPPWRSARPAIRAGVVDSRFTSASFDRSSSVLARA